MFIETNQVENTDELTTALRYTQRVRSELVAARFHDSSMREACSRDNDVFFRDSSGHRSLKTSFKLQEKLCFVAFFLFFFFFFYPNEISVWYLINALIST